MAALQAALQIRWVYDVFCMTHLLINWILSAVSLIIVANVVGGFQISGFGAAFIAAIVIGLVNGTLGFFLKIVTFPLTIRDIGSVLVRDQCVDAEGGGRACARISNRGLPAVFSSALLC